MATIVNASAWEVGSATDYEFHHAAVSIMSDSLDR